MLQTLSCMRLPPARLAIRVVRSVSIDYSSFITEVSKRREPSAIRAIQPLTLIPGMISLGGGYPNVATFPFDGIQVSIRGVKGGTTLDLTGAELERALQYTNTVRRCCEVVLTLNRKGIARFSRS